MGVTTYLFAGVIGILAFLAMRCMVAILMEKIGYDLAMARSIIFIQDNSEYQSDRDVDQKLGKESIRLNLKARIVMIEAIYIVFLAVLLIVIMSIRNNQVMRICLYAVALGAIVSLVLALITEMRYKAEIIFLEECGDGYIRFYKVVSDDEEMLGKDMQTSMDASELQEMFERNILIMMLEMPTGDYIFDRIWN